MLTGDTPQTNRGSFEDRTRMLIEVVYAVRAASPETMPQFLRIVAIEWGGMGEELSWDLAQSIRLAQLLPGLLDVSSGGNSAQQCI